LGELFDQTGRLMCGIAGILLHPGAEIPTGLLAGFAASLAHRGPDGTGEFITPEVALVHTRLAIIDLVTGAQPMSDGPLTLVANGEIYNYRELREALPPHATQSDCEPVLKLFARRSADFAAPLRGMYAIAIHDRAFHTLTLSRDLFGIKSLYIADIPAGLIFASELQVLLAAGVAREIEPGKLRELLHLQFATGTQSIFKGIKRVAPGETLTLRNAKIIARQRLAFPKAINVPATIPEAMKQLDAVLENAVDLHQRSDVSYGMFLSGGVDSAVILAMMARLNAEPVLAFTAGFDDASVADERDAAAVTARAAGARHERVEISQAMVWAHLPEIAAAMDDPVADYAIIPTWFLAQRAAAQVKLVLSGEGGDEMFAGYGRYRAAARWVLPKSMRRKSIFDGLDVLRYAPPGWRGGIAAAEALHTSGSRIKNAQRIDIEDWLPHDLLLKLDRCLMAHGVEGRTPLIDREIAAFAFSLPDDFLVRRGVGKYILRLWLEKNLPQARPFAKKQGFDVPVGAWISVHAKPLSELLARQPVIHEIAHVEKLRPLLEHAADKQAGFAAWSLLFTALWHRRHVLDLKPAGDVFESLSEV
jgi:asparagine synthase (glutamine-hydrolysing)